MICLELPAFLHFAAFLAYFSLAIYMVSGKLSTNQRMRIFLIACCLAVGSLERLIAHNTCVTPEVLKAAELITRPAWIAATPLCFLLLLGLSKLWKVSDSIWTNLVIAVYILAAYLIDITGQGYIVEKTGFGWLISYTSKCSFVYYICDMVLTYAALAAALYAIIDRKDNLSRLQASIVGGFGFVAVAGLTVSQIVLPHSFISDSADLFNIILVAGAVLAINRFGFVSLTTAFVSEAVFRSISEMMMVVDLNGMIIEANESLKKKAGFNDGRKKGNSMSVLFLDGESEVQRIRERVMSSGSIVSMEIKLADKGTGLLTASTIKIGGINAGIACVIADITAIKKMQDEIQRNYDRMIVLDSMKTSLTHSLTHDLKTPMVSIKGFVAMMLKGDAGAISERQKEMLEIMNRNISRQLKLISDMLGVAKMEGSGVKLDIREFNMASAAADCLLELTGAAAEKKIRFELTKPAEALIVRADEFRIWQVMENILGNAVKFSPEGSVIKISVSASNPENAVIPQYADTLALKKSPYALFSVTNPGTGISGQDIDRIFIRFEQAGDTQSRNKGTGLGLSIAKSIIQAHGGAIWAESEGADKGAVFKFVLPV